MLFAIIIIGFLFLGLIVKLAEGVLRIGLIVVVLILLIIGSIFSSHNAPGPSAALSIVQAVDAA